MPLAAGHDYDDAKLKEECGFRTEPADALGFVWKSLGVIRATCLAATKHPPGLTVAVIRPLRT